MPAPACIRLRFSGRSSIPIRPSFLILSLFLCLFQLTAYAWPGRPPGAAEDNPALEAGLRALREGDAPLAVTLLISSAETEEGLSAEAWIGLGVAYRRTGRLASSREAFSRAESLLTEPLLGWIRLMRVQVLVETGLRAQADSLLAVLASGTDDGPLGTGILEMQLQAAVEKGERDREAAILENMVEKREGNPAGYAERLAEIVGERDAEKANELRSLALALPGSDEARGRSAEELIGSEGALGPEEALAAGRALYDLAQWESAEKAFRTALEGAESAEFILEARYRLGLSLYRQRAYRQAAAVLAEVKEAPGRFRTTAAYYFALATAASSSRRAAAEALVSFADSFPSSRWAPRTLRTAGERLIGSDYEAAKQILTRLVTQYPAYWENADILFRLGSGARDAGDMQESRQWYVQLGQGVFHPHEKAQGWFWAARMAEADGDTAAAGEYYGRAGERYPDTYYGARARIVTKRGLPEPVDITVTSNGTQLTVPEWADPSMAAGLVLMRAGLTSEGELQLLHSIRGHPLSRDRLYSVWELCKAGRAYGAAVRLGERLLRIGGGDGDDPLVRELEYPLYYADIIAPEARERGLDPFLVLALIKQESAFESGARSYMGARGLMQLMPSTAEDWAGRLRMPPVEGEDLYDPVVNLSLGIPYLGRLVSQFDGSIEKALAAYNAGATNVRRWERGLIDDRPETFVESIGFSETRTFVRSILNNYYRYRYLWSRNPGG